MIRAQGQARSTTAILIAVARCGIATRVAIAAEEEARAEPALTPTTTLVEAQWATAYFN